MENIQVTMLASSKLPTKIGEFDFTVWKSDYDDKEHILLSCGDLEHIKESVLVRIQSQCITSECFLSLKCDCRKQLHTAMEMIQAQGQGMIIYLYQEGRGIGLINKIKAYQLQEKQGLDTVEANEQLGFKADMRNYQPAINLLYHLKIHSVQLISNNPRKFSQLEKEGIIISKRIPLQIEPNSINKHYLQTKKKKLGHLLDLVDI